MASKGPLFAEGRTAQVFAWGDAHVLKLYHRRYNTSEAEIEAQRVQAVIDAGINTPTVIETLMVEDRAGIIFERVDGPTMLDLLLNDPSSVESLAVIQAEVQTTLHQHTSSDIPELNQWLQRRMGRPTENPLLGLLLRLADLVPSPLKSTYLTTAMCQAARQRLNSLPSGNALCHGDLGPPNIIITDNGPVIIDWLNVAIGSPAADVARSILLAKHAVIPLDMSVEMKQQVETLRQSFTEIYLETYMALTSLTEDDINAWLLPMAAARVISEPIPNEEKKLLGQLIKEATLT